MSKIRVPALAIMAVLVLLLTACGGGSNVSKTAPTVAKPSPTATPQVDYPPVTPPTPDAPADSVVSSFRPLSPMPTAAQFPQGSRLKEIYERGYIRVGVYNDLYLWSWLGDPDARDYAAGRRTPYVKGFDADLAREIVKSIWPNDDPDQHIQFIRLASSQRMPAINEDRVDIVIATMTISSKRKTLTDNGGPVDFSIPYFMGYQKVLVRVDSGIKGVQDLSGKRICLVGGSTAQDEVKKLNPYAVAVTRADYTDCLLAMVNREADAILSDDAILAGLAAQYNYSVVVGDRLTYEPYGIAVSKSHPELTAYINGVILQMEQDGRWKALYDEWLARYLGPAPQPPTPVWSN